MKKKNGIVGAIVRLIGAAILPSIFIVALCFALNQSFGIGLSVIISLLIIQLILGLENKEAFAWTRYSHFRNYLTGKERFKKKLNFLFNLTKVLTVVSIFRLIYLNYWDILNPFGYLGITIAICLVIIFVLLISLSGGDDYKIVRGCLAVVVLFATLSFTYLTFKTQLIWLPLIATIAFGSFEGYSEIKSELGFDEKFLIIVGVLAGLVSTIIQFWSGVANFFVAIWDFIMKVVSYELLPKIEVWNVILLAVLVMVLYRIKNKIHQKRKKIKIQMEDNIHKKEIADMNARKDEKEAIAIDEKWKEIEALAESLRFREATFDELVFVAKIYFKFDCLHLFSAAMFTNVFLGDFFTISEIKKQIIWQPVFESVIDMFSLMYEKEYKDEYLESVTSSFNDLVAYLSEYKDFVGYEVIQKRMNKTKIPINWES